MPAQSWWKRVLGWGKAPRDVRAPKAASETPFGNAHVELIPGQLSADVYSHDIPTPQKLIPCWTYVSNGLQRHGQAEVVFTLMREPHEAMPPLDPLKLFRTINQQAQAGNLAGVGDYTMFGDAKFFGRQLLYVAAQKLSGIPVPQPGICAILITDDELDAVQQFGATRVIARLGNAASYYPCPPWSERKRAGVSFAETRTKSLLARIRCMPVPGCFVYQRSGDVVLYFTKDAGVALAQQIAALPDDAAFAMTPRIDPNADGCFVWEPGQAGPAAITPPGSTGQRICGCFVVFLPLPDQAYGVRQVEDGFVVTLAPSSWRAVKSAIGNGEAIRVDAGAGQLPLVVQSDASEVFSNPVDGRKYVATGGWKSYGAGQRPKTTSFAKHASIQVVRLLTPEKDIEERTTVKELAEFCNDIHRNVDTLLGTAGEFDLQVQFRCTPHGHEVQMTHPEEADARMLQDLRKALTEMDRLSVKEHDVSFLIHFRISP